MASRTMASSFRKYARSIAFLIGFGLSGAGNTGDLALTAAERAWLDRQPVIRIAPDPDFPPIESFDPTGNYQGIAADYVSLLEQKLGIQFAIVRSPTWSDALQQARAREVDMFSAAASTPQREAYMSFTTPHIELPGVILVRTDLEQNLALEDLYGSKVAVVENYVWQELIAREHPEIELVPVPNLLSGLKSLSFGRVDAMVANLAIATHYIEKAGITNLRVAGESGYYGRYAFAVRNDWPELKNIIEKGLAEITPQEKQAILNKWVHLRQQSLFESRTFWISLTVIVTLIVMTLTLGWIWSLRRMVASKTSALRESEQRYRTLYDSANEAIFILDDLRVIDCNQAAANMFHCQKEQLLLQSIFDLSPCKQADGSLSNQKIQELIALALDEQPQIVEWQHRRLDGESFPAEVSLNRYTTGQQKYILAMVRDITERKQVERLKEEFISNVSHEIRTPLTSIRGALSLITRGNIHNIPQETATLLEIAHRNSKRLLLLVNDLLDLQKHGVSDVSYQMQPLDVAEFLEQAVSANVPYGKHHQVDIRLAAIHEKQPIMADSDRLNQVMNNLISNAVKFSPPHSTVEIRVTQLKQGIRISVFDQGPGIPVEFQPHLFDRFTQANASSTRAAGGTGLGLNITKMIVERHNGLLSFNTQQGEGTEFYFEIPLLDMENLAIA